MRLHLLIKGKGSYGEVYKCKKQNELFAVKKVDRGEHAQNELQILKKLSDNNVIQFIESFEDKGCLINIRKSIYFVCF